MAERGLENVEYIKSQIESEWTPGTYYDIHYFVQGEDTLSYSQGNFNDGFGAVGYTFYQMNNITLKMENILDLMQTVKDNIYSTTLKQKLL